MGAAITVKSAVVGMSMDDQTILGRIDKVDEKVNRVDEKVNTQNAAIARIETMVEGLVSSQKRCDDHARRLKEVEETQMADKVTKATEKRIQGATYAALALGIPTITAIVVRLIK